MTRRRPSRAAHNSSSSSLTPTFGGVGLGGAGVAFSDELTVDVFEVGDACGQVGPVGCFELGAELQAQGCWSLSRSARSVLICSRAIGLPLESWRLLYAAAGWSAASLSYWIGDINAAELCRRRWL